MKKILLLVPIFVFSLSCDKDLINDDALKIHFDFQEGNEGWTGGFADYPVNNQMELDFYWSNLPEPLNTQNNSLFITGYNQSDDLFMFFKKKITGLKPNTSYAISFDVEFASKYPTNTIGVGGPPGEAVVMKGGASPLEPVPVHSEELGYPGYIMNIDKGCNSCEGKDMIIIGHIGVDDETTEYSLIKNSSSTPFESISNSEGEIWVIIGTDSGYEGITSIYYNQISLTIQKLIQVNQFHYMNYYKY